jgi:hypothetical protein
VITFLLAWCALSIVATFIALAMIRTGKRRHPEADDSELADGEQCSNIAARQTPQPIKSRFTPTGQDVPVS